jgi:nucleoid associated protein NdpA
MANFDLTEVKIEKSVTHHVGNKSKDETIGLSNELTTINNEQTLGFVLKYYLQQFKPIEFHQFTHSIEIGMNEIYTLARKMFSNPEIFINESQNIARLLYENSDHPKIKSGELNVVYFSNVIYNNESVDAIGLFKSESNIPFLQMNRNSGNYNIIHEYGFELKGIDKACLIFNVDRTEGYKVLVIDNTNKSTEAQYWHDGFLQLIPCNDEYNSTREFMKITKDFVTKKLSDEFEVSKTEKIDLLNRTMDYFKNNETFDKEEFEQDVFQDSKVINSFNQFDNTYREENDLETNENFQISNQAVKKQSRAFKSVLKLDKNFHVYIHGDKDLIERGSESDGRKYYKIYYENEE